MYITYDEYTENGGALSESAFDKYVVRASAIMDIHTFGRLNNSVITDKVKRCCTELIDTLSRKGAFTDSAGGSIVQSQSNDGVSATYLRPSYSEAVQSYDKEICDCIRIYLTHETDNEGTPLLYRGVN